MKINKNRYRVDTHTIDGIDGTHYVTTTRYGSLREAKAGALREEKRQKRYIDHSMTRVYSTITSYKRRYRKSRLGYKQGKE